MQLAGDLDVEIWDHKAPCRTAPCSPLGSQHAIDRRAANLEPFCNLGGAKPIGLEFLHLALINGRLSAPANAGSLRLGDTLKLALAAAASNPLHKQSLAALVYQFEISRP
jgi:hypothetical protein